jgi:flagellar basal-body rod protein FlgG
MDNVMYVGLSRQMTLQRELDVVANNIANAETAGFKVESLNVETEPRYLPSNDGGQSTINFALDSGVTRDFSQGALKSTGASLDMAIEGDGFFQIQMPNGETGYSRSGSFHLNGEGAVVTADGYQLEPQISIPANATSISVSRDGVVSVSIPGQTGSQQVGTIELASFQNPAGLRAAGSNIFLTTTASGEPQVGAAGEDSRGTIAQGFLEDSNVSVVEEMVNMILGQRAYEANSKVIKAADEMLSQVNTIVR